jgi:hypothetical protein
VNYLQTHPRRLVAAILLVGAMGLALALTHSARSANAHRSSSSGYVVSYYKQAKLLGTTNVAAGRGLDVVWKDTSCSNGYSSPPVAFTWTDASTGVTSAPIMGPCGHAPGTMSLKGADDLMIGPDNRLYWTYKGPHLPPKDDKISNPQGATIGTAYLYGRTALYAHRITPGKPYQKISVPAGAGTITFAPAP